MAPHLGGAARFPAGAPVSLGPDRAGLLRRVVAGDARLEDADRARIPTRGRADRGANTRDDRGIRLSRVVRRAALAAPALLFSLLARGRALPLSARDEVRPLVGRGLRRLALPLPAVPARREHELSTGPVHGHAVACRRAHDREARRAAHRTTVRRGTRPHRRGDLRQAGRRGLLSAPPVRGARGRERWPPHCRQEAIGLCVRGARSSSYGRLLRL